ncbi:MAG TPA: threonine/serine dehydratase [Gemmatimonadales bacterium]|nr:threonine/serine dehydratase [Gemmatimonadales bacterium]
MAGPTLDDIREAAQTLRGVTVRTPLRTIPVPGGSFLLKCEQLQPIGAFKLRGAYTAVARLGERRRSGVITSSSGNHGLALAWSARAFGVRAVVVMPESAARVKVDAVRAAGGEVVFAGRTRSPEQMERAEAMAHDEGLSLVPPFDHLDVITGQATCGLEILEDAPDVTTLVVPVGGGGLLAGISAAVAALKPNVRVIGAEPEGAAKLGAALAAGAPVSLAGTESIADGLLPRSIGRITWEILSPVVREAVQVSDLEIADGMRHLYERARLTVEPSGAVTTAALLVGRVPLDGVVVAVATGGNVDPALFQRLVLSNA